MQNDMRFGVLLFLLVLSVACGSSNQQQASSQQPPSQQPQGSALTTNAPAGGSQGAPATTQGNDMRAPASSSATAGSSASNASTTPAPPIMMPMDVPSGTELNLTLETPVSSETAKPEQTVRARVAKAVVISGMTVIPEGAPVTGTVVAAERSGRVKGRASLAIRFNRVTVASTPYTINTARIARQAEATKGEDATKIGIGAGAGAAIGAIAGGKKGAAIGAGVGGGAGTGAVLATRGKEVSIPAGTTLRTTIQETVRITAPM
jgi:hypothetical protein